MPFQSGNLLVAASSSGQFSIGQSWTNFGKDAKANRGGGRITDILDIPDLGAYCKILGCLGKAPGSTGGGAQVTEPDADWPDRFAIPHPPNSDEASRNFAQCLLFCSATTLWCNFLLFYTSLGSRSRPPPSPN